MSTTVAYNPILTPNEHQVLGTNQMVNQMVANFDDQGLGKTKQCYDTIADFIASKKCDLAIIVAKASLRENIVLEIKKDAQQLKVLGIAGTKKERLTKYRHLAHHVIVISYETLTSDISILLKLTELNKVLLAFDESHYLKNIKAQRTKAALSLSESCIKTLIFSGTPAPNGIKDMYSQLKILGLDVGEDLNEFKKMFPTPEALKEFLGGKFIRRKKETLKSLNLPGKNIHNIKIPLSDIERSSYNKIKNGVLDELSTRREINISNVLSKLLRLHQLASNPKLLLKDLNFNGSKIEKLIQVVTENVKNDKKIIIWTSYRENIFEIENILKEYKPLKLIGGMTRDERVSTASSFQNDPNRKILIATPACAREGFTLTAANVAVYLDRSFSLLDWAQSQDRIHRISQKSECHIICLQAENTIDEKIDQILDLKGDLQSYLLGDTVKPPKQTITYEELLKILS